MGMHCCASILISSGKSKSVNFLGDEVQNLARVACSYLPKNNFICGLGHNWSMAWLNCPTQASCPIPDALRLPLCLCFAGRCKMCKDPCPAGVMSAGNAGGPKLVLRT